MSRKGSVSGLAMVAALVAIATLATAAVLYATGDASLERLGLLFAVFGTIIPGLIAALRSDQAATQTNGSLDGRIQTAVAEAIKARRSSDRVVVVEDVGRRATDQGDTEAPSS